MRRASGISPRHVSGSKTPGDREIEEAREDSSSVSVVTNTRLAIQGPPRMDRFGWHCRRLWRRGDIRRRNYGMFL
jgi:hypothetical protein